MKTTSLNNRLNRLNNRLNPYSPLKFRHLIVNNSIFIWYLTLLIFLASADVIFSFIAALAWLIRNYFERKCAEQI